LCPLNRGKVTSEELNIDRPDNNIKMPVAETKPIIPYSEDEIKKLLAACENTKFSDTNGRKSFSMRRQTCIRDKAIVHFLLDSGLRVSEFARLQVRDINLESGEVIVKPFRRGRKSKSRICYIGNKSKKVLWRYLADRDLKEDDYLFVTRDDHPMNKDNIRQMLDQLGKRAKIKKVFAHKFRHTFAIQFLRNGGNVFELQKFLGHSSLTMVKTYLSIAQVDLEKAFKKASPVDNWNL
jgi:integrase/recombinase XerD